MLGGASGRRGRRGEGPAPASRPVPLNILPRRRHRSPTRARRLTDIVARPASMTARAVGARSRDHATGVSASRSLSRGSAASCLRRPRAISSSSSSSRSMSCSIPSSSARSRWPRPCRPRRRGSGGPDRRRASRWPQRPIGPARVEEMDGRGSSAHAAGSRGRRLRRGPAARRASIGLLLALHLRRPPNRHADGRCGPVRRRGGRRPIGRPGEALDERPGADFAGRR